MVGLVVAVVAVVVGLVVWACDTVLVVCGFPVRPGDDAYFNIPEFWRTRHSLPTERMLQGRFYYESPLREQEMAKFHRTKYYVPYPLGMGYIMTYDVAEWVATSSIAFKVPSPEDALMGMWIHGLHLNLVGAAVAVSVGVVGFTGFLVVGRRCCRVRGLQGCGVGGGLCCGMVRFACEMWCSAVRMVCDCPCGCGVVRTG